MVYHFRFTILLLYICIIFKFHNLFIWLNKNVFVNENKKILTGIVLTNKKKNAYYDMSLLT
jgi:hypothetical protein